MLIERYQLTGIDIDICCRLTLRCLCHHVEKVPATDKNGNDLVS